jgi:hypothetical protein
MGTAMPSDDGQDTGSRRSGNRRASLIATILPLLAMAAADFSTAGAAIEVPGSHDTIQGAIDAASPGDTVLVAPGTYTGAGNVGLDFGGKDIVLIAPAGPESTVIDCESASRGFVFQSGESRNAVVDGFTITNGRGSPGAGLLCMGSSPTIRNVMFLANRAMGWQERRGGGAYCTEAAPILEGVTFLWNRSDYGGGMACSNSAPELRDVVFLENSTFIGGAGLYGFSSSLALEDVTFDGNETRYGGGGAYLYRSDAEIIGSRFEGNQCEWSGGGLYCRDSSPVSLTEATFLGNTAGREGAGVYCEGGALALTGVAFARNAAGTYGGAASLSGGTAADLVGVTVVANAAGSRGSGVCCRASHPDITLSVFAFNGPRDAILCLAGSDPVVTRCVVFGNEMGDGLCGTHSDNLCLDPLFCDLYADDLRLCANSPCLPGHEQNPWGALVGAHGEGCGSCDSPVERVSWGAIKAVFLKSGGGARE